MRALHLPVLALVLALPLAAQGKKNNTPAAKAETEKPVKWDGEWTLEPEGSDKIETAIEDHVKEMNFAKRTWWKRKLQKACESWPNLDITASAALSILYGRELPVETEPGGSTCEWKRKNDDKFQVRVKRETNRMALTFQGDGYTLEHVYTMRASGDTLAIQITYTHPDLPTPFTYKLVYKRNG